MFMLEYLQATVLDLKMGLGFVLTKCFFVIGAVLLLSNTRHEWKAVALKTLECAICIIVYFLIAAACNVLIPSGSLSGRVEMAVFLVLYCLLRSKYGAKACVVRASTYLAGVLVMLPVSEPIGKLLQNVNDAWFTWAQFFTPLIMALMIAIEVWYLRHFAFDTDSMVGTPCVLAQLTISAVTAVVELSAEYMTVGKDFLVTVSLGLWVISLLTYYLFYTIVRGTEENERLLAMNQKVEMESEKYQTNLINYEELRTIRHEIKNHNFYMKALLDEGKIDEMRKYLEKVTAQGSKFLKTYDSGNYAIDVVMTHELAAAKNRGVTIRATIIVPKKLPFSDDDLCSLLSNLLENAIESAAKSGVEQPTVRIHAMPKQEVLLIRVENPVDTTISPRRRLSLETTKSDHREVHGYGTKIIRRIAQKYNGSVQFNLKDGIFIADVMLELPEETEERSFALEEKP